VQRHLLVFLSNAASLTMLLQCVLTVLAPIRGKTVTEVIAAGVSRLARAVVSGLRRAAFESENPDDVRVEIGDAEAPMLTLVVRVLTAGRNLAMLVGLLVKFIHKSQMRGALPVC